MSAVHRSLSLLLSALALAQLLALGGCASKPGSVGSGDLKDRVTASDEPDSSKRARLRLELASLYFSRGQYAVALDQVSPLLQTRLKSRLSTCAGSFMPALMTKNWRKRVSVGRCSSGPRTSIPCRTMAGSCASKSATPSPLPRFVNCWHCPKRQKTHALG